MPNIAIIGGGPGAISLCKQLYDDHNLANLDEFNEDLEISIFEKGDQIGAGLPYATKEDCYILNLPKEIMEPIYGQSGHFAKWLETQKDCPQDTKYPPRRFFGRYLEFLAKEMKTEGLKKGFKITYHLNEEVVDISRLDGDIIGYEIKTQSGKYVTNYVVLATGHMPSTNYTQFIGQKGYTGNPWDTEFYQHLNPVSDIGVIGTRLTAIDVALKLHASNHRGKIHMISRRGLLPTVLSRELPSYALKYLTLNTFTHLTKDYLEPLKLNDLIDLFWKEVSEAEGKTCNLNTIVTSSKDMSAQDWLTKEIHQAELGDRKWQQVLFAFYSIIPNVWSMLHFKDQKRFLNEFYGLFITYLAAFPLDNAYKIMDLIKSGQLTVNGGLNDIVFNKDKFQLKQHNRNLSVNYLINATGSGYQTSSIPLYRTMFNRGLIAEHHLGGIKVVPQTLQVIDNIGRAHKSMYALGEPTRGACLLTADMSRVSAQASRVSYCLSQSIFSAKKTFSSGFSGGHSLSESGEVQSTPSIRFFNNPSTTSSRKLPIARTLVTTAKKVFCR
jgi:uncharacterized NAD(P)/FAD-binding protein YdhS